MPTKNNQDEFYSGLMVDVFDNICSEQVYKERAKKVVKLIRLYNSNAKTLLELACGTGNFTKQLAKAGFGIDATDISKDEIRKARTKSIKASFGVADMSKLQASKKYDIICCFWESFRYLPSYKVCEDTLKRISKALNNKGLFLMDISHFPPHKKAFKIPTYKVRLNNNLCVLKQTSVFTKGNFDTRWDDIQYQLKGKDITGEKIKWNGKTVFLKPRLIRSPLLRISQIKMEAMFIKTGFEILKVESGFAGFEESMLFIVQKR